MRTTAQTGKVTFSPTVSLNRDYKNDERNGIWDRKCESLHIGGLVWLIFKVIGEWINYYYSNRKEKKKEAEGQDKTEK